VTATTPEPTPTPALPTDVPDPRTVEERLRDMEIILGNMHGLLVGLVSDAAYIKENAPKMFDALHQQVSGTMLGKMLGL
jgi:hypothetical protein